MKAKKTIQSYIQKYLKRTQFMVLLILISLYTFFTQIFHCIPPPLPPYFILPSIIKYVIKFHNLIRKSQ
jgi:hypothetical protein